MSSRVAGQPSRAPGSRSSQLFGSPRGDAIGNSIAVGQSPKPFLRAASFHLLAQIRRFRPRSRFRAPSGRLMILSLCCIIILFFLLCEPCAEQEAGQIIGAAGAYLVVGSGVVAGREHTKQTREGLETNAFPPVIAAGRLRAGQRAAWAGAASANRRPRLPRRPGPARNRLLRQVWLAYRAPVAVRPSGSCEQAARHQQSVSIWPVRPTSSGANWRRAERRRRSINWTPDRRAAPFAAATPASREQRRRRRRRRNRRHSRRPSFMPLCVCAALRKC